MEEKFKILHGDQTLLSTSSNYRGKLRKTVFLSRAVSSYFPYPCIPVTFLIIALWGTTIYGIMQGTCRCVAQGSQTAQTGKGRTIRKLMGGGGGRLKYKKIFAQGKIK